MGRLLSVALSVAAVSCCMGRATEAPRVRHVLVIGIDGARPDAVRRARTPALDGLVARGAFTFAARTQSEAKTKSGPGWASVLTGVDAKKHAVADNGGFDARNRAYPTFIARSKERGLSTFVAAGWAGILGLTEPGVCDWSLWSSDALVTARSAEALRSSPYVVNFVHLDGVDHEGHASGFDPANPQYIAAIEVADSQVADLVAAVKSRPRSEEWLVVVTTDHGGEGKEHGALDDVNRTIWLVLAGPGVVPGEISSATQMDVHPTVMQFLGVPAEPAWGLDGHVVGLR